VRCPHEPHVVTAATENSWTSSTRAHVASCEACATAAGVAPFISHLAGAQVPQRVLPDPVLLWLSAQLPPPAVAERVGRPVRIVQLLCYLMAAATWIGLLASKWRALEAWVSAMAPVDGGTLSALALCFTLLSSLLVTLALHAVLADEG